MKKLLIPVVTLLALFCLSGVALAEEAPTPQADVQIEAEATETAPAVEESTCGETNELQLEGIDELLQDPTTNVCSCIDLCRSDAECVMRYGAGSTCEPQGPCDCKECTASM